MSIALLTVSITDTILIHMSVTPDVSRVALRLRVWSGKDGSSREECEDGGSKVHVSRVFDFMIPARLDRRSPFICLE